MLVVGIVVKIMMEGSFFFHMGQLAVVASCGSSQVGQVGEVAVEASLECCSEQRGQVAADLHTSVAVTASELCGELLVEGLHLQEGIELLVGE